MPFDTEKGGDDVGKMVMADGLLDPLSVVVGWLGDKLTEELRLLVPDSLLAEIVMLVAVGPSDTVELLAGNGGEVCNAEIEDTVPEVLKEKLCGPANELAEAEMLILSVFV